MRDYGVIHSQFWSSTRLQGWSADAQRMGAYLLTCKHGNIIGVFELPDGYITEDLCMSTETVSETLQELFRKDFLKRCATTKYVWITKFLDWNPIQNPNQSLAAEKALERLPERTSFRSEVTAAIQPLIEEFPNRHKGLRKNGGRKKKAKETPSEGIPKGSETVAATLGEGFSSSSSSSPPSTSASSSTYTDACARENAAHSEPDPGVCSDPSKPETPAPEVVHRAAVIIDASPASPGTFADDLERVERDAMEDIQRIYPKTTHQADWLNALRRARKLVGDGAATWLELRNAVVRYAHYASNGGVSGPDRVKAPQNFFDFNGRAWAQAYDPPPTKAEQRTVANLSAAEQAFAELMAERALRGNPA